MQFKHKLIYFALGCAFVVIAQVLLSVVVPKVTAQGEGPLNDPLKTDEENPLLKYAPEEGPLNDPLKKYFEDETRKQHGQELKKQTGNYRIYQPTTSAGYEYLLNTETGDCWRKILYTDISAVAWVYMPKEPPMQWEDWIQKKIQEKQP